MEKEIKKEFNLSEKIKTQTIEKAHLLLRWKGGLIPVEYVKEFIRRLKEELFDRLLQKDIEIINQLAGEKLR